MKAATAGIHLSIVIPAYNESARLPSTLANVLAHLDERPYAAEVIVSDDGSSDDTTEIIESVRRRDDRVVLVASPTNRGKGSALKLGVRASRGTCVIFFDADQSYPLSCIEEALVLLDGGADLVVGARDLGRDPGRHSYPLVRRAATLCFNAVVEGLLGLGVADTQCGFKAFEGNTARSLFEALTIEGFGFDVELLYVAHTWSLRLERLPVEMTHESDSSVRLLRDSVGMFVDVVRVWDKGRKGRYPRKVATRAGPR